MLITARTRPVLQYSIHARIPSFSTTGLTVTNVAANITLPASANAVQGETMVVSGSFSDPGADTEAQPSTMVMGPAPLHSRFKFRQDV